MTRLIVKLGAPAGMPPAFYKDTTLATVAIPALIVAVVLASAMMFTPTFWVASVVATHVCAPAP